MKKKITVSSSVPVLDRGTLWLQATEGDIRMSVTGPGSDNNDDIYLNRKSLVDWCLYYGEAIKVLDEANRLEGKADDL